MGAERLAELLRAGHLRDALAEAARLAAHYSDEAESCTNAGEGGAASRAERRCDEMCARKSELEFRIDLAARGGGACPACGAPGRARTGPETTAVECTKCGRHWDSESDLRFLHVVRAPVSQFGRDVFLLGPEGRETGDERRLASFLADRMPGAPLFAWHRRGVEVTIPQGTRGVRANDLPVSGTFTLAEGGSIAFGGYVLTVRPARPASG